MFRADPYKNYLAVATNLGVLFVGVNKESSSTWALYWGPGCLETPK